MNLKLSAETDAPNVSLKFKKSFFETLEIGSEELTELYIHRNGTRKPFQVTVRAASEYPVLKDKVIITITSLIEEVEDSFRFVRDLLSSNPECLELNELLAEAHRMIELGDLDKAQRLLDDISSGCRYLISEKDAESESPSALRRSDIISNSRIWIILGVSLFLLSIFIFIKQRNDRKYLENFRQKNQQDMEGQL